MFGRSRGFLIICIFFVSPSEGSVLGGPVVWAKRISEAWPPTRCTEETDWTGANRIGLANGQACPFACVSRSLLAVGMVWIVKQFCSEFVQSYQDLRSNIQPLKILVHGLNNSTS